MWQVFLFGNTSGIETKKPHNITCYKVFKGGRWGCCSLLKILTTSIYRPFQPLFFTIWSHIGLRKIVPCICKSSLNLSPGKVYSKDFLPDFNSVINNPYNALIINNIIEIVPNYLFSYYILFLSLLFLS